VTWRRQSRRRVGRRAANRLLMLDDVFPNLLTGFRVAEFNSYLRAFPAARVLSTQHWFPTASGAVGFDASYADYAARYPDLADRVGLVEHDGLPPADLAYLVFLNNALHYLHHLERHRMPFVVTIYPGGGMQLDQPGTDEKLKRVLGSRLCRGVITTQRVTREYLISKGFVDEDRLVHVFGVVADDPAMPSRSIRQRLRYGFDKNVLDVVFVAHRYTTHGIDKGYDVFIDAARQVVRATDAVRFHVVGPWQADGYPTDGLEGRLFFHGTLAPDDLQAMYCTADVIVSPSRPFILSPGAYDGFPLGSCVGAGLLGAAVIATNELGEDAFRDGEDLLIVRPDPHEVADRLLILATDPAELRRMGENAQRMFTSVYSPAAQLAPRMALLRRQLC
jgi:glycosyltransferase involved in cell wall biosynthesis